MRADRLWLKAPGLSGLALVVLLLVVNGILAHHVPAWGDLVSLLQVGMPLALATVAQGLVILTGGIDLSVGGVMSLVNVVVVVEEARLGFGGAVALALALALVVGLVDALAVVYARVQPLVATLAMSFVTGGIALSLLPQPGGNIPSWVVNVYQGTTLGLPTEIWFLLAVFIAWVLVKRRYGLPLYATGGGETAARRNGVAVDSVRLWTYTLSGFLAGVAGVALTAEIASGDATVGASFVLPSVAAVVLGGTRLAGGFGGLAGPVLAAFALTEVSNVVFSSGVSSFYENIVGSGMVLLGLAVANLIRRRSNLQRA
jgi:ribose transport system permease protein